MKKEFWRSHLAVSILYPPWKFRQNVHGQTFSKTNRRIHGKFFVRFVQFFFLEIDRASANDLMVSLSSCVTQGPYFRTYGPYFRTSSKSLNGRKIARMAPILTIFGPNRSRRRDLFFEKFSNERRRHRRLVLVSSSPSSSPPSSPSSPQHNYLRSQLLRAAVSCNRVMPGL